MVELTPLFKGKGLQKIYDLYSPVGAFTGVNYFGHFRN
jgi:hypothetical protein